MLGIRPDRKRSKKRIPAIELEPDKTCWGVSRTAEQKVLEVPLSEIGRWQSDRSEQRNRCM